MARKKRRWRSLEEARERLSQQEAAATEASEEPRSVSEESEVRRLLLWYSWRIAEGRLQFQGSSDAASNAENGNVPSKKTGSGSLFGMK